jgi:hypothetical protein
MVTAKVLRDARRFISYAPVEQAFIVGALAAAPVVALTLHAFGLRRTLGWARRASALSARRDPSKPLDVERGEQLVRRAFAYTPVSGGCLPESIVQYLLHTRFGPEPRLVVGVRRERGADPSLHDDHGWKLGAHAWVEAAHGPERLPELTRMLTLTNAEGVSGVEP